MGVSACGQPAVGDSDAITPAMPIFILSGIRNGMGVSAGNSEERLGGRELLESYSLVHMDR